MKPNTKHRIFIVVKGFKRAERTAMGRPGTIVCQVQPAANHECNSVVIANFI